MRHGVSCLAGYSLLLILWVNPAYTIEQYYMESLCGGSLSNIKSLLMDSSLALTYSNDQDCTTTVSAPAGQRIFIQIRRFATEESNSQCFDYFSIYDGTSRSADPILLQQCGQLTGEPTYTTSSNAVTFHFKSDGSAKDRGFSLLIMGFTTGTCSDKQLQCDTWSICIDKADSWCNNFPHCPSGIDEDSCQGSSDESPLQAYSVGLAVGLSLLGVALLIIVSVISRYLYKKYKWNQFLKQLYTKDSIIETKMQQLAQMKEQAAGVSYPVTINYQSDEYINKKRMERDAQIKEAQLQLPNQSETSLQSAAVQSELGIAGKEVTNENNNEPTHPLSHSTPEPEPDFTAADEMERAASQTSSVNTYANRGFIDDEKVTEL